MAKAIPQKYQEFLDEHFSISPMWGSFHKNLKDPDFISAVRKDERSDPKLKRFAKMVGLRETSTSEGISALSDGVGTYKVRYHPEVGRFSCTCPDWTYKRSVKYRGAGSDCKHIQRMGNVEKEKLMKTASTISGPLRIAKSIYRDEKNYEQAKKMERQNELYKAYFPPREGLLKQFIKSASARGRAARSLLEG
jgi:hypothetical protein